MTERIKLKGVRFSYFYAFKGKKNDKGELKFSTQIILPKNDPQVKTIKAKVEEIIAETWPKNPPKGLKKVLRDANAEAEKDGREVEPHLDGMVFFNCSANEDYRPQIVDSALQPALSNQWGSGDFGNVTINLYPFLRDDNKGVGAGLGNVQFTKKGASLGGGSVAADEDFEVEEGDEAF